MGRLAEVASWKSSSRFALSSDRLFQTTMRLKKGFQQGPFTRVGTDHGYRTCLGCPAPVRY